MTDDDVLFSRTDAALLLAVEAANGGELAGLVQVLGVCRRLFHSLPDEGELAESFGMLVDAGLVEWRAAEMGLTPAGRKLLRHAGMPGADDRPYRVLELLGELGDGSLAEPDTLAAPEEHEVAAALSELHASGGAGPEPGDFIAPPTVAGIIFPGAIGNTRF